MPRCYRCKTEKPVEEFAQKLSSWRGIQDWCRVCRSEWKAARSLEVKRAERQRWREMHPEKHRAQKAFQKAVQQGRIIRPDGCERCGGTPVHGHHADYTKRYDVEWLCPRCHGEVHAGWTWPDAA